MGAAGVGLAPGRFAGRAMLSELLRGTLASKFVKVVLSGAGGDELFAGYPWRYYRGINSNSREDYLRRYYDFWQRLVPDDDKQKLFNNDTTRQIGDHSTFDVLSRCLCAVARELQRQWRLH
jgi:asparagine synthase (glutamine-hydrolysing)